MRTATYVWTLRTIFQTKCFRQFFDHLHRFVVVFDRNSGVAVSYHCTRGENRKVRDKRVSIFSELFGMVLIVLAYRIIQGVRSQQRRLFVERKANVCVLLYGSRST